MHWFRAVRGQGKHSDQPSRVEIQGPLQTPEEEPEGGCKSHAQEDSRPLCLNTHTDTHDKAAGKRESNTRPAQARTDRQTFSWEDRQWWERRVWTAWCETHTPDCRASESCPRSPLSPNQRNMHFSSTSSSQTKNSNKNSSSPHSRLQLSKWLPTPVSREERRRE